MFTKKNFSALLVVVSVSVVALLALFVRVGATTDTVVVIKTDGMTCENCVGTIRTALERVKGVAATEIDVAGGWVIVGFDSKVTRADTLAQKVTETGFSTVLHALLSPEQFRKLTGRELGRSAAGSNGCFGRKGGCCNGARQKS